MQFTKTFVSLALAASALAVPTGGSSGGSSGAQCCQNVQNSNTIDSKGPLGLLLGLLGVVVSNLNVPIGTGCTPVDILGGVSCNTNTVTCGSVFAPQLIGINCVPVIANV